MKKFSYSKQSISEDDIQAVVNILGSDWLTQGPKVAEFENALKQKFSAEYASVTSSGTAALHLIALALGWKQGDIILTSPMTFLASANCIIYTQAAPDFVDIDPVSYTMDINRLEDKLKFYAKSGKKVKAVIAIDYAGHPCDWKRLKELSMLYGFQLVNDAAHALGATIDGKKGYAAEYADAVNLSFHPVKHITTGEGGAVLTNDKSIDQKIKTLRTHGMTKDEKVLEKNDGPWYYEMHDLGYNYRITDFQCALGISQLKKLDMFVEHRQKCAHYYDKIFTGVDNTIVPHVRVGATHAYHLYPFQIDFRTLGRTKIEFFRELNQKRIYPQVHYIPIHLQPYYRKAYGFKQGDYPVAEEFYLREISLPIYDQLVEADLEYISKAILSFVHQSD